MNNKINEDLKNAMKSQDKFTLGVLRMLKSALQLESINKKQELNDSEIIEVIKKQVKLRKDSISEFAKFGKEEEIAKLDAEIAILARYLPEEATDEEINQVLDEIFALLKPTSMKDMGQIMKEIKAKLSNVDMAKVSNLVKQKLS